MPPGRREPVWLDRPVVDAAHLDQLREHGGLKGFRDENTLESALARPKNLPRYEKGADLAKLGATYTFLAMAIFVELNGYRFEAPEDEVVQVMLVVADRRCNEPQLVEWARRRLVKAK